MQHGQRAGSEGRSRGSGKALFMPDPTDVHVGSALHPHGGAGGLVDMLGGAWRMATKWSRRAHVESPCYRRGRGWCARTSHGRPRARKPRRGSREARGRESHPVGGLQTLSWRDFSEAPWRREKRRLDDFHREVETATRKTKRLGEDRMIFTSLSLVQLVYFLLIVLSKFRTTSPSEADPRVT